MVLLEYNVGSRLSRACTVAAVFYISEGQVGGSLGSSKVSSSSTLLIDLFFFLYDYIFLIPALALSSHILEEVKALIIVCLCIVC
jgi:hypothetical protein